MGDKQIRMTRHAVERGLRFDLDPSNIEKIIREGQRFVEGKSKVRYVLRLRRGVYVAICEESPDLIVVKTITRGK